MEASIKTAQNWILYFKGFQRVVPLNSPLVPKLEQLMKGGAPDSAFLKLIDPAHAIKNHPSGLFGIDGDQVYVKGEALPKSLSDRVLDFSQSLLPFEMLLKFWDRCQKNPDARAKSDLYSFLEHNGHPITTDGCFVAYRYVRDLGNGKFVDAHTGTMDNSVGTEVTKDRSECDPDPDVTCSRGLHCAAYEYAAGHGPGNGYVVVEVKVDPADVVAVPKDYNGQKMRVCRFVVMCVNQDGMLKKNVYDEENIPVEDNDLGWEDDAEDDMEEADESGAMCKPSLDFAMTQVKVVIPKDADDHGDTVVPDGVKLTVLGETKAKLRKHAASLKRDKHGHFLPRKKK